MNIIIAGAGIAGLNAAKAARETNADCSIILLDSEDNNTYLRTRIPDYIAGSIAVQALFQYDDDWYIKNNINFIKNASISNIDPINKIVNTKDNSFPFDSLVIALGSSSFIPPIKGVEKQNVFAVRSLEDANIVKEAASKGKTFTIIGGGLLGLEMSWAIRQTGASVNVIENGPRLLTRQADDQSASLLYDAITSKGINIYLNAKTDEICGDAAVEYVRLSDGTEIKTDFVVLSTGVRANIELAKNCNISTGRAIKVNDYMETSIKGIYAAGDAAEFNEKNYCIWPIAVAQGKTAGANAAGSNIKYTEIFPYTQLKIKDITMFSIGDISGDTPDRIAASAFDKAAKKYIKLYLKDGVITGAIVFGDSTLTMKIKKAVDSKVIVYSSTHNITVEDVLKKI